MYGDFERLLRSLDRGFYHDVEQARKTNPAVSSYGMLTELAKSKGYYPEDKDRERRAAAYLKRFRVPAESRKAEAVVQFAQDTWALERACDAREIRTHGPH